LTNAWWGFVAAFLALPLQAAPVTVGPVVISVPEGFEAAQTQRTKNTLVAAWTRSVRASGLKTLLQINVTDLRTPAGKPPSEAEPGALAEKLLRQSLEDIERRRSNYTSSPVAHVQLAGIPAARATWNGSLGERAAVGVMYCVIVRNRYAVILHTQDLGNTPSSGMLDAMQAIESMTLAVRKGAGPSRDGPPGADPSRPPTPPTGDPAPRPTGMS
jgi:hypothetical protein